MDIRTGHIYETLEEARKAGVPDEFLVQGDRKTLDYLKPRIKFTKGSFKKFMKEEDNAT